MPDPLRASVQALLPRPVPDSLVDAVLADARIMLAPCGDAYDQDRQDAILRWLGAHMLSNAGAGENDLVAETIDGVSYQRSRAMGEGLRSTFYGQNAVRLDTLNCLSDLGRDRVELTVL